MRRIVSSVVVVVLLAGSPAAASGAPAPAKAGSGELTSVCVDRGSHDVRAPGSGACRRGEDRVVVGVADRLRACLVSGRVKDLGSRACQRRGGRSILLPGNRAAWFCADVSRAGRLRGVSGPGRCDRRERALESRNHRPGPIRLSDSEIPEDVPVGTAVGTLTATDRDRGDRAAFRLERGAGDADNARFAITGGALVTAAPVDFETRATYRVRVRVTDRLGLHRSVGLRLRVVDAEENRGPTDVSVSPAEVLENQPAGTVVGTLTTEDPDDAGGTGEGDRHTYTLVTDPGVANDNPLFEVVGDQLRTLAPLDHEDLATRTVRVRTDDGAGGTLEKDLRIDVADANDAPTAVALRPDTLPENAGPVVVGTLDATDQDAEDTHVFALVPGEGDRDNAGFEVRGDQLAARASLDFEARSSYTVRVRVVDAAGASYDQAVSVTVTDANDAPAGLALSPASIQENRPAGTTVGRLSVRDGDAGDQITYALVTGAGDDDNGAFEIDGDQLVASRSFDYEDDAALTVRVRATDRAGLTGEEALDVAVVNANERATRLDLSATTVAENLPAGTLVGTLSTDDPDGGDPHSYALLDDAGGRFRVDGDRLETAVELDYESATAHTVDVRSTDSGGETVDASFVIAVEDANEAPSTPTLNDDTVDENLPSGTEVGTLSATDPDAGDTHTFTLVDGEGSADNASFSISGATLRTAASFDHEAKATYSVRVRVTDNGTPARHAEQVLTVHVADVNEAPSAPTLVSPEIDENADAGALVGGLVATDPDAGQTLTFALAPGGVDNALFQVTNGSVYALQSFDFEAHSSYAIRVSVSDGHGGTATANLTVTVRDANDAPTAVSLSDSHVSEDAATATVVGRLSTADQDAGDSHTYSLVAGTGGADNAKLTVVGDELRTAAGLDHESAPTLHVRVRSSDGEASTEQAFTITVDDVNETPTGIALSSSTVVENLASQDVGTLSATDPEGGSLTYDLVAGAGDGDNASFSVSGSTLRATATFDFESRSALSVRVRVTDSGGLRHAQALAITVTDANDAPTGLALDADSVVENSPAGTEVGTITATDPDAADTFGYELVAPVCRSAKARACRTVQNALFSLTTDGVLSTATPLDHEAQPAVPVLVEVTDRAGATYRQTLTVTVTDVNEKPTRIDLTPGSVAENEPAGSSAGVLSALDEDAEVDDPTFALVAGSGDGDNGRFTIVGDELHATASFDYETTASYTVRVRATDAGGETLDQALTVAVVPVNETPAVTGPATFAVDENEPAGTPVASLTASDPEADTLTWSLVSGAGSADNASFALTAAGALTTGARFDFETTDTYQVRVRVSDGSLAADRELTVRVRDVNDAPTVVADSYTGAIGNTDARAGSVVTSGPTSVLTGDLPLGDDSDQDGDPITVQPRTGSTSGGGSYDITATGAFRYTPPRGIDDASDTFPYTVTDGAATTTGTITVTIADRMVWYLRSGGPPGDGTSRLPYATTDALSTASDPDGPGDEIFVYGGAGTPTANGLALEAGQKLIGQGIGLEPGLVAAGATPTLSRSSGPVVSLANGSSIDGIVLRGTGTSDTVTATGVKTSTIGADTVVKNTDYGVPVSITGAAGGDITVAADVEAFGGGPMRVTDRTSGTMLFSGAVTTTSTAARAISLNSNTGATVRFTGGLSLATGANPAFSAAGGGTIEVTGTSNTITTTTGTPLSVRNTTIGSGGLTFRSISSNGAASGILLENTGTSGGLTVTGSSSGSCGGTLTAAGAPALNPDPADCTGGTIAASTGRGVSLVGTKAPSLTRMRITGSGDDGIYAAGVTGGLTVASSSLEANGDAADENGIDIGDSSVAVPNGATGTVTISDTAVGSSADTNVYLGAGSGSTTLAMLRDRITGAGASGASKDGVRIQTTGTGAIASTIDGSYLAGNAGSQVEVASSGSGQISSATVTDNTVVAGGGRGVLLQAAGSPWTGSLRFDVARNAIRGRRRGRGPPQRDERGRWDDVHGTRPRQHRRPERPARLVRRRRRRHQAHQPGGRRGDDRRRLSQRAAAVRPARHQHRDRGGRRGRQRHGDGQQRGRADRHRQLRPAPGHRPHGGGQRRVLSACGEQRPRGRPAVAGGRPLPEAPLG